LTQVSSTNHRSLAACRAGRGGVDELGVETLHPAVDRDVIDLDAAFYRAVLSTSRYDNP
jgi:hypothetical protein